MKRQSRKQGTVQPTLNVEVDAYEAGLTGYGINIEGNDPPGMHLMCVVLSQAKLHMTPIMPKAEPVSDDAHFQRVLFWLTTLALPEHYEPIDAEQGRVLALTNPPGHGEPGFVWQGGSWVTACPALGGRVYVSLAQAVPQRELFAFALMFRSWKHLARRLADDWKMRNEV